MCCARGIGKTKRGQFLLCYLIKCGVTQKLARTLSTYRVSINCIDIVMGAVYSAALFTLEMFGRKQLSSHKNIQSSVLLHTIGRGMHLFQNHGHMHWNNHALSLIPLCANLRKWLFPRDFLDPRPPPLTRGDQTEASLTNSFFPPHIVLC